MVENTSCGMVKPDALRRSFTPTGPLDANNHTLEQMSIADSDNGGFSQAPYEAGKLMACVAALIACIGSFCMGAVGGWSSPAIPDLNANRNPFHTNEEQNSWVGSIMTIGALFGGLIGGPFMDKFGRKLSSMLTMLPWSLGWVVVVASPNVSIMLVGRFLTGLCAGVISCIIPVYIGEIAPASIRGILGSCHQLCVCIGILFTFICGSFLSWTWLAIAISVFCNLFVVAMYFMPESPRWLYARGDKEEAEQAVRFFLGQKSDISRELDELEETAKNAQEKASLKEFMKPVLYKPLLISMGLMLFQQWSGVNVIMFYTVSIFQMAGSSLDPNLQTIAVGAVGVLGTLGSMVVIDLAGRRILLFSSGALMTLSMGGMGYFFYQLHFHPSVASGLAWLPMTCLILYNFGFDIAYGPIPWVMMGELFPARAKGVASSIATAFNWFCAFLITKFFVDISNLIGVYGGYWLITAVCFLSLVFVGLVVPETKGKTLEDIERIFK